LDEFIEFDASRARNSAFSATNRSIMAAWSITVARNTAISASNPLAPAGSVTKPVYHHTRDQRRISRGPREYPAQTT